MTTPITPDSTPEDGAKRMVRVLAAIGEKLGLEVATEIAASDAAWLDLVWFDKRFSRAVPPGRKPRLNHHPVVPLVAFEVENKTGLSAKHLKGSVSNLMNSGAQLGVIVIGRESLALLRKLPAHAKKPERKLEKELLQRARGWVSEARPTGRVIVISERELRDWARREGVLIVPET